jgi:hypothetical protein
MNNKPSLTISVEKIDVDDLIKDFKVLNIDNFSLYLKEVWRVRILPYKGPLTKKRRQKQRNQ